MLAALSVGARNFEEGLGMDGSVYATVSRRIVQTGHWFALDAQIPFYKPLFAEHPHLGFWIGAIWFRLLPSADWAARLLGHTLYILFLWFFFHATRRRSSEPIAILTILMLWSWAVFSNTFSSFYLDPG